MAGAHAKDASPAPPTASPSERRQPQPGPPPCPSHDGWEGVSEPGPRGLQRAFSLLGSSPKQLRLSPEPREDRAPCTAHPAQQLRARCNAQPLVCVHKHSHTRSHPHVHSHALTPTHTHTCALTHGHPRGQRRASPVPFSGPLRLAQQEAGAGDRATRRVRAGLERGTSANQPQRGPSSSALLPCSPVAQSLRGCPQSSGDAVRRLAGSQKWPWVGTVGLEEGHQDQGSRVTWHKEGSHQAPSVCICGGARGGRGAASGPGVRQAEILTWDPGSSCAAEEGTRCEARPLCPGGNQAAGVLSPRKSECIDHEQPPPEQTWERCGLRARVSPASPLHRSWGARQQRSQGLQDQCRPIQRRLSRAMLGPGASLGTETWGQAWVSAPPTHHCPFPSW